MNLDKSSSYRSKASFESGLITTHIFLYIALDSLFYTPDITLSIKDNAKSGYTPKIKTNNDDNDATKI